MISIYTLTSELHNEAAVAAVTKEFLDSLDFEFMLKGADFSDYGQDKLSLIYVRTGGTENIFLKHLDKICSSTQRQVYLLTSGKSNSLAASMEILSYLRKNNIEGEIIHGSADYINSRVAAICQYQREHYCDMSDAFWLGVIGAPSDWLISSGVEDYQSKGIRTPLLEKLGIMLVPIDIQELVTLAKDITVSPDEIKSLFGEEIFNSAAKVKDSAHMATAIYLALDQLACEYELDSLTLRCFDLLTSLGNTGCVALAKLNSEGIPSSCEGDIPALISMMIINEITGISGFQANPSRINPETGEFIFAHCTVPFDMVTSCKFDTHYESGIGVGIKGELPEGDVTVFKLAGDLSRYFVTEGTLVENLSEKDLCRTQVKLQLDGPAIINGVESHDSVANYFLSNPISNHHIIIPGHWASQIIEFLKGKTGF